MENIKISHEIRSINENKITMFIPTNTNSKVLYHPKHKVSFVEQIDHQGMMTALKENPKGLKVHLEHNKLINIAKRVEYREVENGIEFDVVLNEGCDELRKKVEANELQVSFGFKALEDTWNKAMNLYHRVVEKLELFEISLVENPAYASSFAECRSLDEMLMEEQRVRIKAKYHLLKLKGDL
ncbi:HK97 family phage prohead protease [Bacillus sp. AGMB 02131]|uniref:HK97 family phage prohead protease n=1 Tax=Peribacillus faecalis TaxID=2772559 RepID=A0A927CU08_9BACI|nr:HK97 family phage prohead protease [Peribacillus faecalis]MBD3107179.1 HK97 family phage prohead protease [Peribacillus faecalis]